MENQEKQQAPAGEQAARKHHHKKHRNHRHNGPRPEGSKPADAGNGAAVAHENKQPKNDNNRQGSKKKSDGGQKNNGDRRRNNDHRNGDHKKRRQNPNRGPENLYGNPTENDVLTMEELRARIVLKAADGSVPAEEPAPKPAAEPVFDTVADPFDFPTGDAPMEPMPDDPEPATEEEIERVEIVGIRFRSSGKVYYFDPKGNRLSRGDFAIVETARGPEFGEVSFGNRMVRKTSTVSPLRPVLRAATDADIAHNSDNMQKEKQAMTVGQKKIEDHKLEMKLIDVQYAFDNSKLLFYFTADGRVDFRDLVKDLASVFRTRIELRQIGIRDEAKMLGGLGSCGRPLCCASFLSDFVQVSIKMAKEQGLSLNSAKISGLCGRLMCCLRYESEVYAEEIRRTPSNDSTVKTPDGVGTVVGSNPLAGTVKVVLKSEPDSPPKQYSRDDVTVLPKERNEQRSAGKGDQSAGKQNRSNAVGNETKEPKKPDGDRVDTPVSDEKDE